MKKIIILLSLLTITTLIVLYATTFNQNTTLELEREVEYLGPNSDTSSLSNEEINFEQNENI